MRLNDNWQMVKNVNSNGQIDHDVNSQKMRQPHYPNCEILSVLTLNDRQIAHNCNSQKDFANFIIQTDIFHILIHKK